MPHSKRTFLRLLGMVLFLAAFFQAGVACAGDHEFVQAPADFAYERLASSNPVLMEAASMARSFGVTIGIYGGTVRDLYLGHAFTVISDLDLIYDSSEKGFPAYRDALIAVGKRYKGQVPSPDFHFDLSDLQSETSRQKLYHTEGITATKVGILADGRMLDPTGFGVQDLRDRVFRYYPPTREFVELHNLGRFARDLIRLPGFRRDEASLNLLRRSLARYADPQTPEGKRVRQVVARSRYETTHLAALRGEPDPRLYTFADFINPVRRDGRYQHNDLKERLTPFFPLDMFMFDLFRSITQADSMDDLREGLKTLEIDRFLITIGLESEAKTFMAPGLSRTDLFKTFRFPGTQATTLARPKNFLQIWENRLRQYSYRVLFDMLASEFPSEAPERKTLESKRDDFLATASWRMLNPDDDYPDMILGVLDPDFNLKVLPRERVQKSLSWFASTYLPMGPTTLQKISLPPNPETAILGALFNSISVQPPQASDLRPQSGFSREVRSIDLSAPHSFRDLNGYLAYLVGPELIDLFRDPRTTLAFFLSDESTAVTLLQEAGFPEVYRANACGFSRRYRSLLGYDPHGDRICLAQIGFHSVEQWVNHQARFACLLGPDGATPGKILTWQPSDFDPTFFPDRAAFHEFLETLGQPVDTFFIGFTNPLKTMLTDVRSWQIGDLSLKTGYLPQTGVATGVGNLSATRAASHSRRLVLALSAFGANYGSLPANVAKILLDRGLRQIVILGTGGGLVPSDERFGWIIPDRAGLAGATPGTDRPLLAFRNAAADLPIPVVRRSGSHVTVCSPLVETRSRVQAMRRRLAVSVDCELYWIVRLLAHHPHPAKLFALINLTDFPIGDERELSRDEGGTISIENSPLQFGRVQKALETLVGALAGNPLK